MIESLSLRGLGLKIDDPLVVAATAVQAAFVGWHLHLHLLDTNGWTRLTEFCRLHTPAAVTWVCPIDPFADAAPDSAGGLLADFARCAAAAAEIGCRAVSTWLPPNAGTSARLIEWLPPIARAASSVGLALAVEAEPWPGGPSGTVEETLRALAQARDVAGTIIATALDSTFCDPATVADAERYGLAVADVHVAAGRRPRVLRGLEHDRPCRALLRALEQAGYRGPVMVESFSETGRPPLAAARDARQRLGALLARLDERDESETFNEHRLPVDR